MRPSGAANMIQPTFNTDLANRLVVDVPLGCGASHIRSAITAMMLGSPPTSQQLLRSPPPDRRERKPRQPTLARVAKQASKAGIDVARYEVKPDGTVVVVTGTPESSAEPNPWLDDLKVTKQ